MLKHFLLTGTLLFAGTAAGAQDRTAQAGRVASLKPALVKRSDLARGGIAAVGVGLLSLADESVAKASQRTSLQNRAALRHSANIIQTAGDPGALLTSVSLYIIGASVHRPGLADAGLHSTEAIAVGGALTQLLKLGIGRARPNLTHDNDAYVFHTLRGYQTDFNSFPSGHTSAAFAAATVFSAEVGRLHPGASNVATPALYTVATLVGASRMYNNRHWLSDVVGGALIGHFVGKRITAHAHATASH